MSLTARIAALAAPLPRLDGVQRYLFIGPHPDDIEVGAGATAARLTAMGKQVSFLICTDGRFGLANAPAGTTPEQLAEIRREESLAAARVLGVKAVRFLPFSDGGLYDEKELFAAMAHAVGELQPDILFAPDPCVTSECHADHLNVGEAARRLALFAPYGEIMEAYGAGREARGRQGHCLLHDRKAQALSRHHGLHRAPARRAAVPQKPVSPGKRRLALGESLPAASCRGVRALQRAPQRRGLPGPGRDADALSARGGIIKNKSIGFAGGFFVERL